MIEQLQLNLKEEYRAVFDFEVALFQTVCTPSFFLPGESTPVASRLTYIGLSRSPARQS